MNIFLHGFADELVKLGNVLGGARPSAPTHRAPSTVKQPGEFKTNKMKVNFGQAPKKGRFREVAKGPNISAVNTPTETAKTKPSGPRRKKSDGAVLKPSRFLPGERVDDMKAREARTATESAAWKKRKAMGSTYNTAYGRQGEKRFTGPGAGGPRTKRMASYNVPGMEAGLGGVQKQAPAVKAFKQNIPTPKPVSETIRMRGAHGFVNVDPSKKAVPKMRNAIDMSKLRPG